MVFLVLTHINTSAIGNVLFLTKLLVEIKEAVKKLASYTLSTNPHRKREIVAFLFKPLKIEDVREASLR